MRRSFLIMFVILLVASQAQARESIRVINVLSADGNEWEEVFMVDKKEAAKMKMNTQDGVLEKTGKIPDGVFKTFAPTGYLLSACQYKNEKLDGLCTNYFEDGKVMSETMFKDGQLDGRHVQYYKNGSVQQEIVKSEKGEMVGKEFYESGKLKVESVSAQDGGLTIKNYDEQGNLIKE